MSCVPTWSGVQTSQLFADLLQDKRTGLTSAYSHNHRKTEKDETG